MNSIHRAFASMGLVRNVDDKVLGGVCSGIARRFDTDPWAVRVLVLATLLLVPGSQVIIYPILWVLMPDAATAARLAGTTGSLVVVPSTPNAPSAPAAPMATVDVSTTGTVVGAPVLTKTDTAA